jgi:hypothetical protein
MTRPTFNLTTRQLVQHVAHLLNEDAADRLARVMRWYERINGQKMNPDEVPQHHGAGRNPHRQQRGY